MSQTISLSNEAITQTADNAATFIRHLITKLLAAYAAWIAWPMQRHDAVRLHSMDDRMLADIGLARSEIGHVVSFGRHGG